MKTVLARQTIWGASVLIVVALAIGIANCSKPPSGLLTKGHGVLISKSSDIAPDADPSPQQVVYAGTVIPVEVKRSLSPDGSLKLDFWYQGVSLETEIYRSTPTEFDLVNAAGEDYAPPIPLLRFPMNAGDSWKWSGQMMTGPTGRSASAVVSTREDKLNMADAIVVQVDLNMESGSSAPATRELTFRFVKGKGVIEREFGASTSRGPAEGKKSESSMSGYSDQ